MKTDSGKQPLVHVVRRNGFPFWKAIIVRIVALFLALVACALFVFFLTHLDPVSMYKTMFNGTFGSSIKIWRCISASVKLLCISLALGIAFKMKFWNCGGEGQVLMGALGAAIVMVYLGDVVPNWLLFVLMFLVATFAGALWGGIPAICKAKMNTNETLFTLMMNYIAIQLVSYFCNKWKGLASTLGKLNRISKAGWFPEIKIKFLKGLPAQTGVINIFIVIILMFFVYVYLNYTKHGYEISVVGASKNTARYAGINVVNVIIRTMLLSGAICGLCGMMILSGFDQTISVNTACGYGFTAIIVAWLANFNPFLMMFFSIFVVFLEQGTSAISNAYSNFSTNATSIVVGLILFFIVGCEFFIRFKLMFRKKKNLQSEGGDKSI